MSQLPPTPVESETLRDRRQTRRARRAAGLPSGSISGGVFLIGLGMLLITGWWWPGIMLVIGLASAAELARRGQLWPALTTFLGFAAIPVVIALVQAIDIPWLPVGAFVLITLGLLLVEHRMPPCDYDRPQRGAGRATRGDEAAPSSDERLRRMTGARESGELKAES